jgi:hypothetical protein
MAGRTRQQKKNRNSKTESLKEKSPGYRINWFQNIVELRILQHEYQENFNIFENTTRKPRLDAGTRRLYGLTSVLKVKGLSVGVAIECLVLI